MRIFFSVLITIFLAVPGVLGQSINTKKLDSLLTVLAENNKAMGSLAISQNGKTVYSRAIGYSYIGENDKKPADTQTKYRVGSVTKMFTATLIFQLIEEGKLSTATYLKTYFPEIPNAGKITIAHLLSHHSGIYNFTNDPAYTSWMTQPKSQKEIIQIIANYPSDFEPGTQAAYSNSNYVLLGYIIEKITKKPYHQVLQERIVNKLKLQNTYVGKSINRNANESGSYQFASAWVAQPETDMSIPHAAGAEVSTPEDLTKFIEALFAHKLVKESSLQQMKTITDNYGMGMFQFPFGTKKAYGHTGGIDGFGSMLAYFPDSKLAIAYTGNGVVYPINDILIGALSICFNEPYSIPDFKTIALKPEDLDKYIGLYSSSQLPLKITVTKDNSVLKAQATGQQAFPLDATQPNIFTFQPAGIVMEFEPLKNQFTLKQGGGSFLFTKEVEK